MTILYSTPATTAPASAAPHTERKAIQIHPQHDVGYYAHCGPNLSKSLRLHVTIEVLVLRSPILKLYRRVPPGGLAGIAIRQLARQVGYLGLICRVQWQPTPMLSSLPASTSRWRRLSASYSPSKASQKSRFPGTPRLAPRPSREAPSLQSDPI